MQSRNAAALKAPVQTLQTLRTLQTFQTLPARQTLLVLTFLLQFFVIQAVTAQEPAPDLCAGVVCGAPTECHFPGVCDPATGGCIPVPKPDGSPCNDFNPATDRDACYSGDCRGEFNLCFAVDCRAFDDCHQPGVCDPATGLCSNPPRPDGTPCQDGNPATQNDVCRQGECAGTWNLCFAVDCRPFDQCHVAGVCDPATGACSHPPKPNGTPCNDFNNATTDDVCTNGDCAGTFNLCPGVQCPPTAEACKVNRCQPNTGDCMIENLPDATPCDDGDPLTFDDACLQGECVGNDDLCADVVCDNIEPCLLYACNPLNGNCEVIERMTGSTCDDGDDETYDDACFEGECVGVVDLCAGVVCDAAEMCYESVCNPETGECEVVESEAGTSCDDGWAGTTGDACQLGVCVGRSPYLFGGFLSPIRNWPEENLVSAGSTVVIRFSLGGDFGLDVLLPGEPGSSPIECGSQEMTEGDEPVELKGDGLTYDRRSSEYTVRWSTVRAWKGSCRQLVFHFDDGSVQRVNFRFRDNGTPVRDRELPRDRRERH